LFGFGCGKPIEPQAAVAIEYWISPRPPRVGPAIVNVNLRDAARKPVAGARVKLEANMSHPGMAPVVSELREVATGRYQGNLEFAMPGDWVVVFHVTLPDGRTLEREVNVPGVAAN
jgi:YtkA-like